jgi:hypothetical protein
MAIWKKVIVSGSNISQLNNDANYLTANNLVESNAFATASFNGTNLLADSKSGSLNFASSSGQGLTIAANSGTDTLTFGLAAIPNTSLANSTISGKALGTNLDDLTIGNGFVASSPYNGSAARTIAVGAGSHITVNANNVAVNTTTLAPALTSSIYGGVSGDITISPTGVAAIQPNSVALGTDTTGNYINRIGSVVGLNLTGTNNVEDAVPSLAVTYGSTANTAVQGNTNITINGTTNQIAITGNVTQALGGGPSYTLSLPSSVSLTDLLVAGNLTVQGTASFQSTTNLEVADRFVLLASGSNSTGDGGFVVQQATQDVGELFGWDSTLLRWGVTGSFIANQSGYTPEAFMAAVTTLASANPNTSGPASRYNAVGNIFVSSVDESIWIYS